MQQRQIGFVTPLIVIAFQGGGGEVELAQHIAQARRNALASLQAAAKHRHRHVRQQRQVSAETVQMLVVAARGVARRRGAAASSRQTEPQAAHGIAADIADMAEQRGVEGVEILAGRRRHLFQHERMAADSALTENNHAARQDIGAFYRNGDRRALVGAGEEVIVAEHDAFAARDIHSVHNGALAAMGAVILHNRRQHRRFFALHNAGGDQRRRGVHHVGVTGNARQRLFDAFHLADRDSELTTDMRIGAGGERHAFQAAGGVGGQGNAASHRQALNQHPPALTGHLRAADNKIDRHENIVAARRAVLERHVKREMALADFHARRAGGNERAGNAQRLGVAQQTIGIGKLKGESQHGRHRRQRNVALVPGQAHAEHLLALPLAHADHAGIGDCARVGARFRAGQREAGDLVAARQARQIVIFLLVGAVMLQQFAWAKGVRHADGNRQNAGDARQLLQHARLRIGGELEAAILFFNDHGEETLLFQIGPEFRGQIRHLMGDGEVVRHAARLFHRTVEKRLLGWRQARLRIVVQLLPVRLALKQVAFPPGGPGVDRLFFRARHRRHHLLKALQHRL